MIRFLNKDFADQFGGGELAKLFALANPRR
jgi:hypothetical protein